MSPHLALNMGKGIYEMSPYVCAYKMLPYIAVFDMSLYLGIYKMYIMGVFEMLSHLALYMDVAGMIKTNRNPKVFLISKNFILA